MAPPYCGKEKELSSQSFLPLTDHDVSFKAERAASAFEPRKTQAPSFQ